MKRLICLTIAMILLLAVCSCAAEKPTEAPPAPTENTAVPSPPSAPSPSPQPTITPSEKLESVSVEAISEHTLKSPVIDSLMIDQQWPDLIAAYKKNCTPLTLDEDDWITVSLDINIADYKIIYICPLNDSYGETTSYIDLFVDSEYDVAAKTLKIDCNSLTEDDCALWSFLILATDESENEFYYYTRVAT